jgi:hypothetical protein
MVVAPRCESSPNIDPEPWRIAPHKANRRDREAGKDISSVLRQGSTMKRITFDISQQLALISALGLYGCGHRPAPMAASPPPAHVSDVTLKAQSVPLITELPGRVAALRIAEVRPQVNGIILKRAFVEGSEVKEGLQRYRERARSTQHLR